MGQTAFPVHPRTGDCSLESGKDRKALRQWTILGDALSASDLRHDRRGADKTKVRFNGEAAPEGESDKEVESVDE